MSAQIIVLADHRSEPLPADCLDAPLDTQLAAVAEAGSMVDPYGLVAAVRALAANMERMRVRGAEMQKPLQAPVDGGRTVATETGAIVEAIESPGDVDAFLVCV